MDRPQLPDADDPRCADASHARDRGMRLAAFVGTMITAHGRRAA